MGMKKSTGMNMRNFLIWRKSVWLFHANKTIGDFSCR